MVALRHVRRFAVAGMVLAAVTLPIGASASVPAPSSSTLGQEPPLIVSGLGSVSLSPHIARVGQTIVATFHSSGGGSKPVWPIASCAHSGSTCRFKATTTGGWAVFTVSIANGTGPAESQDAYAVVPKGTGVIQGFTFDKAGVPVAGTTVTASGVGATRMNARYVLTSSNGFYNFLVKPGTYHVVPSGGSGHSDNFYPQAVDRTVDGATNARADFILQDAVKVTLRLNHPSVPADGFQIVQGTISTTYGGKPDPNVWLSLWPKESESPDVAVSSGVRATICDPGGNRIWPTAGSSIAAPDGLAPPVQTDAKGHYAFTLTVGTVPGRFELTAWAENAQRELITEDSSSVVAKQTLIVKPLGSVGTGAFLANFNHLATSGKLPQIASLTNNADQITQALASLAQAHPAQLGGLAYASVSAGTGAATLIYPAAKPPVIKKNGLLSDTNPNGSSFDGLMLSPSEWSGVSTGGLGLSGAMMSGGVHMLPTFGQWMSGAKGLVGWTLKPDPSGQPYTGQFHYYGYGYPNTAPGACY